ncbi:DNA translocase FtsK [Rhizobium rhododendri]|nr:DNA translocase FtsK [Rhizobium sp. rho-13.1]TQY15951.1 DNA translocase FtsK [Rhizobium sp. rho-1.1]
MRFSKTNFSNGETDFQRDVHADAERAEAELREARQIAERRAYLEQKLIQAREAKRRSEIAHQQRADQLKAAQLRQPQATPVAAPDAGLSPTGRTNMPLVPPLVPADAVQDWQTAFSLAPNVRFTRTPESLISRKKSPDSDVNETEQTIQQTAVKQATISPEAPATSQAAEVATPSAQTPGHIEKPRPAAPMPWNNRLVEDIFTPASTPVPPLTAWQRQPVAVVPQAQLASHLANLSDFAFWDVMPFDGELAPPVAAAAPAFVAPPMSAPPTETAQQSATSLYRIIDWQPSGRAATPAPVVPVPEAAAVQPNEVAEPIVLTPLAPATVAAPPVVAAVVLPKPATVAAPAKQVPVAQIVAPAPKAGVVDAAPNRRIPVSTRSDRPVSPAPMEWRPVSISSDGEYELPPRELLQEPPERVGVIMTQEALEQNAGLLENVLEDFGVKGEIIHVRPGPVVTLYEFEPAPGVKSSRVIGLADDIARSMSALSARVAVVPGRNVIGIELPNATRETVYFREMIESEDFAQSSFKLALGLGKTIGGEPVIAELAKMPHLLVAGTTGSGKSVAINTMILSLLYRMTPEECRLIMVDPKMLELSVYDGIPHLLTPVVTDPKKAVLALKWAVREMEDRYRKMSRLGVRNIDGYNARVAIAREKNETILVTVQTGFDRTTGAPTEESQELDLARMPYIVVIVDEMADLMMVAGKEIEGAIQRLAQMARAAGIHLIMATQRPSVDVITGTIKANFPTRISFQVTSKIDSRTILGEQGAEQLLGQGDMLHMQGGGRISRVHGPFVSDEEVEKVVAHLKMQGRPEYLDTVTAGEEDEEEEEDGGAVFDKSAMGSEDSDDTYEQAIKVVMRDKKCSTSYIQRRLGIGYNRAASLVERMEKEGLVGPANHVGKREIISGNRNATPMPPQDDMD